MEVNLQNPQLQTGKPIAFFVAGNNRGKTTARNRSAIFTAEVVSSTDNPSFDFSLPFVTQIVSNAMVPNPAILPWGVGPLPQVPGTKTIEPIESSQEMADEFHRGKIWFALERKVDAFRASVKSPRISPASLAVSRPRASFYFTSCASGYRIFPYSFSKLAITFDRLTNSAINSPATGD
jgi:hypothetical protein